MGSLAGAPAFASAILAAARPYRVFALFAAPSLALPRFAGEGMIGGAAQSAHIAPRANGVQCSGDWMTVLPILIVSVTDATSFA